MVRRIMLLASFIVACLVNAAVTTGMLAPEFKLQDQHGNWHKLSDYRGKWVVLYFYPKDETPGCTIEARNFRDAQAELAALNAVVIGISLDDVKSHADFAKTEKLNFPILADVDQKAAKAYGVLTSLGPIKYTKRETFIIDPAGNVVKHYADVAPKRHANEVIQDLKKLRVELAN